MSTFSVVTTTTSSMSTSTVFPSAMAFEAAVSPTTVALFVEPTTTVSSTVSSKSATSSMSTTTTITVTSNDGNAKSEENKDILRKDERWEWKTSEEITYSQFHFGDVCCDRLQRCECLGHHDRLAFIATFTLSRSTLTVLNWNSSAKITLCHVHLGSETSLFYHKLLTSLSFSFCSSCLHLYFFFIIISTSFLRLLSSCPPPSPPSPRSRTQCFLRKVSTTYINLAVTTPLQMNSIESCANIFNLLITV